MNKSDLVDALANQAGMTKADAARALEAMFGSGGIIASALKAGTRVQITGFGAFEAKLGRDVIPVLETLFRFLRRRLLVLRLGKA